MRLAICFRHRDNRRIALGIDFENSELNEPKAGAGDSSIRLISSQGFRLSAQMKLGERLLVAQQTDQHDVTRLVQIQPLLPIDLPVAKTPRGQTPIVEQASDEAARGIGLP